MITVLLVLIVVGFILFLFNKFVPIDATIKSIINYVVIFLLVIYILLFVLKIFGLYDGPDMQMTK